MCAQLQTPLKCVLPHACFFLFISTVDFICMCIACVGCVCVWIFMSYLYEVRPMFAGFSLCPRICYSWHIIFYKCRLLWMTMVRTAIEYMEKFIFIYVRKKTWKKNCTLYAYTLHILSIETDNRHIEPFVLNIIT